MRLIDADVLKQKKVYSNERHEKVVPVSEIDWMPTFDPWISVKDRLPEKGGKYLVYRSYVYTAWFAESLCDNPQFEYEGVPDLPGFYNGDGEGDWVEHGITHWMPLPEPPKEDDDGQTD